jgi:hypothetical protein
MKLALALSLLLFLPLFMLAASCQSANRPAGGTRERIQRFAVAFGEAIVQTKGTEVVKKHAPHLMPIIDADHNDVLSLQEILALDFEDPAILALVIIGIEEVIRERRQ